MPAARTTATLCFEHPPPPQAVVLALVLTGASSVAPVEEMEIAIRSAVMHGPTAHRPLILHVVTDVQGSRSLRSRLNAIGAVRVRTPTRVCVHALSATALHALEALKHYAFRPPKWRNGRSTGAIGTWMKLMLHRALGPAVGERLLYMENDAAFLGDGAVEDMWDAAYANDRVDGDWMLRVSHMPGRAPCPGALALQVHRMRGRGVNASFEWHASRALRALQSRSSGAHRAWQMGPGIVARQAGDADRRVVVGTKTFFELHRHQGRTDPYDQGVIIALLAERRDLVRTLPLEWGASWLNGDASAPRFFHFNGHHRMGFSPYWTRWNATPPTERAQLRPSQRDALHVVETRWRDLPGTYALEVSSRVLDPDVVVRPVSELLLALIGDQDATHHVRSGPAFAYSSLLS